MKINNIAFTGDKIKTSFIGLRKVLAEMEITWRGYQRGGGGQRIGEKVQGKRSIYGRYKIDRGRLRIVQEMEKPKNLYV